jgi:hypothetical protein
VNKFHCYSLVWHKSVTCAKAEVTFNPPPQAFYVSTTTKIRYGEHFLHIYIICTSFLSFIPDREREKIHMGKAKYFHGEI